MEPEAGSMAALLRMVGNTDYLDKLKNDKPLPLVNRRQVKETAKDKLDASSSSSSSDSSDDSSELSLSDDEQINRAPTKAKRI